jgi:ATP-dependent DNA helicase
MSSLQKFYYERVVDNTIRDTLLSMKIEGAQAVSQINQLMNLRKVSNHPFLFGEPRDNASGKYLGEANPELLIMASGKLKLLDRMLPVLKEQGHKVLIFSQMTQMLDILQDYLFNKNYRCCRLDGSTKLQDRQDGIDLFNTDPDVFCFLISTKAGGLGINLTAADTCIIFDSDWNPHQDMQAQDRCHRIGQTSNVLVYRFLTAGTVEIEMMQKQISKKKLDRMTMHGGDFRQAGKRAGSQLTLPYLRQLLEDDVQNLDRMMTSGASANNMLNNDGEANSTSTDIPQHELDMLLDRDRLFATVVEGIEGIDGVVAKCARGRATTTIPTEGTMYDIVAPQESSLQAVA